MNATHLKNIIRTLLGCHLASKSQSSDLNFTLLIAERVKLKKSQRTSQKVETYESLTKQYDENVSQIEEIQSKLSKSKKSEKSSDLLDEKLDDDSLESYMKSIKNEIKDESEANLRDKLKELLNVRVLSVGFAS